MSKFSDFIKEDVGYSNEPNTTQLHNDNIEQLIDKYSNYSESELMSEFLKESEKRKENGEFTDEKLNGIKSILSPYLDESQKQKLNDLLNMVK